MTDIVERLREIDKHTPIGAPHSPIFGDAAAEIERLEKHIELLKRDIFGHLEAASRRKQATWVVPREFLPKEGET